MRKNLCLALCKTLNYIFFVKSESYYDVKKKLLSGYHLPAPDLMPELDDGKHLYPSIMENCWILQPSHRPTFKQLSEMLENLMDRREVDKYQERVQRFKQRMEKHNNKEPKVGSDEDIDSGKKGYINC